MYVVDQQSDSDKKRNRNSAFKVTNKLTNCWATVFFLRTNIGKVCTNRESSILTTITIEQLIIQNVFGPPSLVITSGIQAFITGYWLLSRIDSFNFYHLPVIMALALNFVVRPFTCCYLFVSFARRTNLQIHFIRK